MKTTDLFKNDRSAKKINESLEKTFGQRLDLASFDLPKLEDARNKLRTQLSQVRSESGFNETVENEALTKAQWMLDAINAEIAEREEFIADPHVAEVSTEEGVSSEAEMQLQQIAQSGDYDRLYDLLTASSEAGRMVQDMYDDVAREYGLHPDDDNDAILDRLMDRLEDDYGEEDNFGDDGGETDDDYALASAGFGSDEDYGSNESADKSSVPAYKRKEQGGDWKVSAKDLEKEKEKRISGPEGLSKLKKDLGMESAPPSAKAERMVKHIKKGYAKDGKLTDKERSIAYATAWKQHNKEKNESIESGEDMTKLTEGEVQQASAIVTAKTMVDRVSRWIEELSGMENDTLLQLGDSIRDEMSQEQAKTFISSVAPAIQQALENLKSTRETLATGVRMLTGEEQGAEMLGAEPAAPESGEEMGAAEPDMMNAEPEAGAEDEFAAAEPAAGGVETAGREQRESIQYQNSLLKVLAG